MTLDAFHFLRPEWLLALIPAAVLIGVAFRRAAGNGGSEWAGLVDAHLLRHLAVSGRQGQGARWLGWAFAAGLLASVLAMAGPTWQKVPTPTYHGGEPAVIVLSLAQSMNGTDLVPSRLTRAGHKLRDVLDRSHGDDTGLIIYADRPFVAAPLTDDSAVIQQMLPELSTNLMPVLGNRLDLAIDDATGLLQRAGARSGRILVLADDAGIDPAASLRAARQAKAAGYSVNVLGVGTEDGARLETAQGRAIQTQDGKDVTMQLDTEALTHLAEAGGGHYAPISATDQDLDVVFPDLSERLQTAGDRAEQSSDTWLDLGYLLLIVPVLLAPLAFRRGLLLALVAGMLSVGLGTSNAQAGTWQDLWLTPDQQAQQAFDQGDYANAANQFTTLGRTGGALYRAEEFGQAAAAFGADAYNRANALAKSGELEAALAAYDERLASAPTDPDALYNREIVEKLLEQQKQDQQQQQQDQENPSQQGANGQDQPQDQSDTGNPDQQQGQDQSKQDQGSQGGQQQQSQETGDGSQPDRSPQSDPAQQPSESSDQSQPGQDAQTDQTADAQSNTGQEQAESDASSPDSPSDQSADAKQPDHNTAESQSDVQPGADTPQGQSTQPTAPGTETATSADAQDQGESFSDRMDRQLDDQTPTEAQSTQSAGSGQPVLDQAAEQQLRRVPDDPSGLLRARIRDHYARLRTNNQ